MIPRLLRAGALGAALAAATVAVAPAVQAGEPAAAFSITLSDGAAPAVSAAADPGAAGVAGVVDGVRVDDPSCAVTPGAAVGAVQVTCAALTVDVTATPDGATAVLHQSGFPGTSFLCVWVFSIRPLGWRLDCFGWLDTAGSTS